MRRMRIYVLQMFLFFLFFSVRHKKTRQPFSGRVTENYSLLDMALCSYMYGGALKNHQRANVFNLVLSVRVRSFRRVHSGLLLSI